MPTTVCGLWMTWTRTCPRPSVLPQEEESVYTRMKLTQEKTARRNRKEQLPSRPSVSVWIHVCHVMWTSNITRSHKIKIFMRVFIHWVKHMPNSSHLKSESSVLNARIYFCFWMSTVHCQGNIPVISEVKHIWKLTHCHNLLGYKLRDGRDLVLFTVISQCLEECLAHDRSKNVVKVIKSRVLKTFRLGCNSSYP